MGTQMKTNDVKRSEFDPASKRALSVREFCFRYGFGKSKTYELIASGELRSILVGGRRLIPVEAAAALISGGAK
jgi:excisionase family DNA binding protein